MVADEGEEEVRDLSLAAHILLVPCGIIDEVEEGLLVRVIVCAAEEPDTASL